MKPIKKLLLFVLLFGIVAGTLAGCTTDTNNGEAASMSTLADLETAKVGIITGTNWDSVMQTKYPNAERMYFKSGADTLIALQQNKIDAYIADKTICASIQWENDNISYIDEPIETISNALILAKDGYDKNLLDQLNTFIAKSQEDGTIALLTEKWQASTEPTEHPDYTKLTGENGTLKIAVGDSLKPVSYQRGSLYSGYEVDFLTLFAEEYGYKLDIQGMAFDAIIPSVTSGKCDIGASAITITPERMESLTFTDPHFETYGVAIIYGNSSTGVKTTLAEFENATIGVLTGSSYDSLAKEHFPNAERKYYSLMTDLVLAVEQGKIDGFISEEPYCTASIWEGAEISVVDEPLKETDVGFIFGKNSGLGLCEQMDAFISSAQASGLLDELNNKWFGSTEPTDHPDYASLTGENGTIRVAVAPDLKPVSYFKVDTVSGYEMDILTAFAKEYGYKLNVTPVTFDAILPGVTSGKYDMGAGGINITEERRQSVDFSQSHMAADVVMVVKAEDDTSVAQHDFWSDVKESFEKTFIREDRWKLIVEGIGITMLISICAAATGSLLGFGLYMLSRSDVKLLQKLAKGVAKVYSRIIAGTPVVVILMILFYVIFGKIRDMSGIVVAIIGFTLTFGAFVYDHMTVSVDSVDRGQIEAAYALGYTKNKTFFRIIFPQAMNIFLPSYCGQAVELIKATAVVGYVAVNDLTKMGDIIRSNTYEAFFPLIATAVIYFLLTWAMAALLGLVKRHFEPKRRSAEMILKGVKTV